MSRFAEWRKKLNKDRIYVCYDNLLKKEYISINALETSWGKRFKILRKATKEDLDKFNKMSKESNK